MRNPDRVSFVTGNLRHNRSNWVTIQQFAHYGQLAHIQAQIETDRIAVQTDNVRTLTLGPLDDRTLTAEIDGQTLPAQNLSTPQTFQKNTDGTWQHSAFERSPEKHPGASGPIGNLFFDGLILVPGTTGSKEASFLNTWVVRDAQGFFRSRNGGVHRGGIMGQNTVELPLINDGDLAESDLRQNNLLLYGTPDSNAVFARFREDLPVAFDGTTVYLSDKTYTGDRITAFAVFPHPQNPERHVAIHGGVTPDAICWGSHLDMQLLPDYLVYDGGTLIDWGFWGNDWKTQ